MAETTLKLKTTGMHCSSCSRLIELSVGGLAGVSEVHSDHTSGETDVTFDPTLVDPVRIIDEIRKAGYGAEVA